MSILTRSLASLMVLLLLAAYGSAHAQRPVESTLLWEISGNGLEKPSYLYGTIHVRKRKAFRLNDSVLSALRSCSIFASELQFDTLARQFIEQYVIPEDGLRRLMQLRLERVPAETDDSASTKPAEGDAVVVDTDTAIHVPAIPLPTAPSSPASHAGTAATRSRNHARVLSALDPRRRGTSIFVGADTVTATDKPTVIDSYLFGIARNAGLQLTGLETMQEQLGLLGNFGFDDIYTHLKRKRRPKVPKHTEEEPENTMVDAYANGDLARLYALVSDLPLAMRKRMLDDRNHIMAERGEKLVRSAPTFIAVGSGHLPGDEGLIALFRQRGYIVRPVKSVYTKGPDDYGTPASISDWRTFTSTEGGFSVEMPQPPITMPNDSLAGYRAKRWGPLRSWVWPDLGTGMTFVVGYADYDDAAALPDSTMLQLMLGGAFSDAGEIGRYSSQPAIAGGLPASEKENTTGFNLARRYRSAMRGRRGYLMQVVAVESQARSDDADHFFSSFKLLPLERMPWKAYDGSDYGFTAELPGAVAELNNVYDDDVAYRSMTLICADSLAARHAHMQCSEFSSYYTATDTSAVWARTMNDELEYNECVESIRPVDTNGYRGIDVTIALRRDESVRRRARYVLRGPMLYIMRQAEGDDSSAIGEGDRLFNSFRLIGEELAGNVFTPKIERLCRDLNATDAVQRERATVAIDEYPFTAADLPRIYQLLSAPLSDDGSSEWHRSASGYHRGNARGRLLAVLTRMHDSTTAPFLRRNYTQDVNTASSRTDILDVLETMGSDDAIAAIGDLLDEISGEEEDLHPPFYNFYSNIARVRPIVPQMLALASRDAYKDFIYPLVMTAIDSGVVDRGVLAPNRDQIVRDCRDLLREHAASSSGPDSDESDEEDSFAVRATTLARLLGYLNGSVESSTLLKKFAASGNAEVQFEAVCSLARLNQTVPPAAMRAVANALPYRIRLYSELKGIGRLDPFPAPFRTQQKIAEGILASWLIDAADEEDAPAITAMRLLGEREIRGGDTALVAEGRYYLFAFDGGDGNSMVGLSGPQPLDRMLVDANADAAYSAFDARGEMGIDEHFEKLLREMKQARDRTDDD